MSSDKNEMVEKEPGQPYLHGLHCLQETSQCQYLCDNSATLTTLGQVASAGLRPCHKLRAQRSGLDPVWGGGYTYMTLCTGLFLERRTVV